ncbi:FBD-like protein [Artemisia annua]|uniref:FBD-like protein n=1 Tax=Artemisia annua TaxID=35608 RepID=A0A2U1MP63_ARTAN|nr:FBD-like protein [Artemisia annua]
MSSTSENVDMLSNLPRDLLSHILSLMPAKFAMQTSILSKNWRYIWKLVTNLDFSDLDIIDLDTKSIHALNCFYEFVDRVLEHHKASQVNILRLRFPCGWFPHSCVSKWISDAVRLNVSELDIPIFPRGLVELPFDLFTLKSLKLLKLYVDGFRFDVDALKFPSSVNLPSLKTLDIYSFGKPPVNAFKLIHGCPLLENLSLTVSWCSDEQEFVFNIPTLKRLKLDTPDCSSVIKKVVFKGDIQATTQAQATSSVNTIQRRQPSMMQRLHNFSLVKCNAM